MIETVIWDRMDNEHNFIHPISTLIPVKQDPEEGWRADGSKRTGLYIAELDKEIPSRYLGDNSVVSSHLKQFENDVSLDPKIRTSSPCKPNNYYALKARNVLIYDRDFVESIKHSEDFDQAYLHLLDHDLYVARALLELAAAKAGKESSEQFIDANDYSGFDQKVNHVTAQLDDMFETNLIVSTRQYERLATKIGIRGPVQDRQELALLFDDVHIGIMGIRNEISEWVRAHKVEGLPFDDNTLSIYALAQSFLDDAASHLKEWRGTFKSLDQAPPPLLSERFSGRG